MPANVCILTWRLLFHSLHLSLNIADFSYWELGLRSQQVGRLWTGYQCSTVNSTIFRHFYFLAIGAELLTLVVEEGMPGKGRSGKRKRIAAKAVGMLGRSISLGGVKLPIGIDLPIQSVFSFPVPSWCHPMYQWDGWVARGRNSGIKQGGKWFRMNWCPCYLYNQGIKLILEQAFTQVKGRGEKVRRKNKEEKAGEEGQEEREKKIKKTQKTPLWIWILQQ